MKGALSYWIHNADWQLPLKPLIATSKSFFGNAGYILHVLTVNGDSEWGQWRQYEQKVLVPVDIWGHENKDVSSHHCSVQLFLIQTTMRKDSMESMSPCHVIVKEVGYENHESGRSENHILQFTGTIFLKHYQVALSMPAWFSHHG